MFEFLNVRRNRMKKCLKIRQEIMYYQNQLELLQTELEEKAKNQKKIHLTYVFDTSEEKYYPKKIKSVKEGISILNSIFGNIENLHYELLKINFINIMELIKSPMIQGIPLFIQSGNVKEKIEISSLLELELKETCSSIELLHPNNDVKQIANKVLKVMLYSIHTYGNTRKISIKSV